MPHHSRPTMKTRLYLTALTLLLTILSLAACSSDEPTRSTPNPTQQSLLDELNSLSTETATLRQEVKTLKAQPQTTTPVPTMAQPTPTAIETPTSSPTEDPATFIIPTPVPTMAQTTPTAIDTPTPSPTEDPITLIIPTPPGPGICGRSPQVQQKILAQLGSTSCRAITLDELFRITSFRDPKLSWGPQGPKPGDFAGLVNLWYLAVSGNFTLKAGTFAGSAINHLNLNVEGITPGAFENSHIGEMTLSVYKVLPQRPLPPTLTLLDMTIDTLSPIPPDLLANLTELQSLTLSITPHKTTDEYRDANPESTPASTDYAVTLPTGFLDANTRLKHVFITMDRGYDSARLLEIDQYWYNQPNEYDSLHISVHTSLFAKLPHLEAFGVFNLRPRAHTSGTPPLTFHPKSPLHNLLIAPPLSEDEEDSLTSKDRHVYSHRRHQQHKWVNWPYGYTIAIAPYDFQLPN